MNYIFVDFKDISYNYDKTSATSDHYTAFYFVSHQWKCLQEIRRTALWHKQEGRDVLTKTSRAEVLRISSVSKFKSFTA